MPPDNGRDQRAQILQLLLDKINGDTYPSNTMLDMVESLIQDEDAAEDYFSVLLAKVGQDAYPSMDLLRRMQKLV